MWLNKYLICSDMLAESRTMDLINYSAGKGPVCIERKGNIMELEKVFDFPGSIGQYSETVQSKHVLFKEK